jgi:hypothetical protein
MKPKVKNLLKFVLREYDLKQKTRLTNIINKLVAAAETVEDPVSYKKKLDDLIKTYKFEEDSFYDLENELVYNEFYNKLIDFAQDNNISLS